MKKLVRKKRVTPSSISQRSRTVSSVKIVLHLNMRIKTQRFRPMIVFFSFSSGRRLLAVRPLCVNVSSVVAVISMYTCVESTLYDMDFY